MAVRLTRIYTKAGDGGETRLVGGQKVSKDALRIETYGTVDELGACIGLARTTIEESKRAMDRSALEAQLRRVQHELFNLGSDLATLPADRHPQQPVIEARHVAKLEAEIDAWNADLPELRSFVLAGGGSVAASLHLARTVCRRAERLAVRMRTTGEPLSEQAIPYLNRLSDWLFVASRHASRVFGRDETLWEPEKT